MKKIKLAFMFILLCASLTFALTSCGENEHIHIPNSAVKENEIAATCASAGSYDEVVYCAECSEEISRTTKTIEKLSHNASEWITDTEASCKVEGTKHKECTVCHAKLETGKIDKLTTHIPGEAEIENFVDSDCETKGSYNLVTYCSVCNAKISSEEKTVEKKPHASSNWIIDKNATCKAEGTKHKECTVCHTKLETGKIDKLTTHTPASAVIENKIDSTCSELGSYDEVIKCSVCGVELSRVDKEISKKNHTPSGWITDTEATCKADGAKYKECTVCYTKLETGKIDKLTTHTPAESVRENEVAAKCDTLGSYDEVIYCSVCDIQLSRTSKEIAKLPHTEVTDAAKAPTCTTTGLTQGKHCSVCNEVIIAQEIVKAKGHTDKNTDYTCDICTADLCTDHDEEVIPAVSATCTETGLTEGKRCSICGDILVAQEIIKANGHTEVKDEAKAPTCTETGLTEGKHCSVCSTVLVKQETVSALGHTEVVDKAKTPTCTETGLTEGKHCSVCSTVLVKQETVDALGHTEVVDAQVNPTCTTSGFTKGSHCSVCEAIIIPQAVIDALGHSYKAVVTSPNCTERGYTTYTCYCSHEYVGDYVSALGHTEVTDEAVEPTCTEIGLTEGAHCGVCNEVLLKQEIVSARGHSYKSVVTAPTCTEEGYTTYTCHCGDTYKDSYVESTGHTLVVDKAVAPDCTNIGFTEGAHCSVCEKVFVSQEIVPANGHTHSESVVENNVLPDCLNGGHYDSVVYCTVCNAEISRVTVTVTALGHTYSNGICVRCGIHEYLTFVKDYNRYIVSGYVGDPTAVVIPDTYFGLPVYAISSEAFKDCTSMTSIVIPSSVTSFGTACFVGCSSLQAMTMPFGDNRAGIQRLGELFGNNVHAQNGGVPTTLTTVIVTDIKEIPSYAFQGCTSITSISLPASLTTIGNGAFTASGITEIIIPEGAIELGDNVFNSCMSLTSITIPNSVRSFGYHVICSCNKLAEINYKGTKTQWNAIEKDESWDEYCTRYSVYCADGIICKTHTEVIDFAVEPTCTETGLTQGKHCSVCSTVLIAQKPVDALGHTEIVDEAKAPNCTETGLTEGKHCSVCLTVLVKQETVSALGHTEVIDEVKAPTCTETGLSEGKHCSVCSTVLVAQKPVDALGHNYEAVKVAPTCTTNGYTTYTCHCGYTYVANEVSKLGHAYNDGVVTTKPTCEAKGIKTFSCGTCGDHYTEEVDQLGHDYKYTAKDPNTPQIVLTCVCSTCGNAYTETITPIDFTVTSSNRTKVGYTGEKDESLVVPIVFKDNESWYRVAAIGSSAFSGCDNITSITIPNSISHIGYNAFENCENLISVTIPASVTDIESGAFYGCTNLMNVYIEDIESWCNIDFYNSYQSNPLYYASYLYLNGEFITELVIPDGVTEIPFYAFRGCTMLTTIIVPDSVTSIGESAFYGCTGIDSITLPFIGQSKDATGYKAHLGYIFGYSTDIYASSDYHYKEVNKMSTSGYVYYTYNIPEKLRSVVCKNTATVFQEQSFRNCSSLTSFTIPNSISHIGNYAFENCENLISVTIPASVTYIGSDAFSGCTSLTNVYIEDIESWCNIDFYNSYQSNPLYYASYLYLNGEFITELVIPDGVTEIPFYAFRGCTMLTTIRVPDSVTSIGNYAFSDCKSLTSVTIGNGVTSIGNYAFYNCTSLESAKIGTSVTDIGSYAFFGCSLKSIIIPDNVTYIGEAAFRNCINLESITLPFAGQSKDATGYKAHFGYIFGYWQNRQPPSSYHYYYSTLDWYYTYYIPSSLKTVVLSDSVTSIGDYCYTFRGCTNLTSIILSSNITRIGTYSFEGCVNLTSIYYQGTESEWSAISVGSGNKCLTGATCYFYSENEPALNANGTAYDGNYWYYDESGNIVEWVYNPEE